MFNNFKRTRTYLERRLNIMLMTDIIEKKRDGFKLSKEEIDFFVEGYTAGSIPDYQASALCMAIYLRGMDDEEATNLAIAMRDSGDKMDLSSIPGKKVDKHSTGGVGDKTSLVLAPLVASFGLKFAKMSGRGLGHTGGTLDKLESINGYNIAISPEAFINQVKNVGMAIVLLRTIIIYTTLLVCMRILGKRQLGELELSELVVSVLAADLASLPLQDVGIPLINGLLAILTLFCLELILSGDRELLNILATTARVSLTSSLLALLIGVPLGLLLGALHFPGRGLLVVLNRTLMGMPPVV